MIKGMEGISPSKIDKERRMLGEQTGKRTGGRSSYHRMKDGLGVAHAGQFRESSDKYEFAVTSQNACPSSKIHEAVPSQESSAEEKIILEDPNSLKAVRKEKNLGERCAPYPPQTRGELSPSERGGTSRRDFYCNSYRSWDGAFREDFRAPLRQEINEDIQAPILQKTNKGRVDRICRIFQNFCIRDDRRSDGDLEVGCIAWEGFSKGRRKFVNGIGEGLKWIGKGLEDTGECLERTGEWFEEAAKCCCLCCLKALSEQNSTLSRPIIIDDGGHHHHHHDGGGHHHHHHHDGY